MGILNEQPKVLDKIHALKKKLLTTDRDDHWSEVLAWEKRIKELLLVLALQKHEGIGILMKHAKEQIGFIDEFLNRSKIGDGEKEHTTLEHNNLIDRKEMWEWFCSLFNNGKSELEDMEKNLDYQLKDDEPEAE